MAAAAVESLRQKAQALIDFSNDPDGARPAVFYSGFDDVPEHKRPFSFIGFLARRHPSSLSHLEPELVQMIIQVEDEELKRSNESKTFAQQEETLQPPRKTTSDRKEA